MKDCMHIQIPHPADLEFNQTIMTVRSYDEQFDTFAVHVQSAAPNEGQESLVPAVLMPKLVGFFGEPHEYTDRQFLIEA